MREADLQRDFELELASLHRLQDLRNAAVADRSNSLAQNARIHAALEDNALDLLYPSARAELRDLMEQAVPGKADAADTLHARFYRFLDSHGAVLVPPNSEAGELSPNDEARLAQSRLPQTMQTGYLDRNDESGRPTVDEIIAVPIRSTETNEVIAALVLGFKPVEAAPHGKAAGMKSGILVNGKLQLPTFNPAAEEQIGRGSGPRPRATGEQRKELARRNRRRAVPALLQAAESEFRLPARLRSLRLSARSVARAPGTVALADSWRRRSSFCLAVLWSASFFPGDCRNLSRNWPSSPRKTSPTAASGGRAPNHRRRAATLGPLFRGRLAPIKEPNYRFAGRARFTPRPRRLPRRSLPGNRHHSFIKPIDSLASSRTCSSSRGWTPGSCGYGSSRSTLPI